MKNYTDNLIEDYNDDFTITVRVYMDDTDAETWDSLSYVITHGSKTIKQGKIQLDSDLGDIPATLEAVGDMISDFGEEYDDWAPNSDEWHIIIDYTI